MKTQSIVRDSAGQYYCVQELEDPRLSHAWLGQPVKKNGTRKLGHYIVPAWAAKRHALPRLIRKAGCEIIASVTEGDVQWIEPCA